MNDPKHPIEFNEDPLNGCLAMMSFILIVLLIGLVLVARYMF